MQDFDEWLAENTEAGPTDNLLMCNSARAICDAFCRANGLPVCDASARSLIPELAQRGLIPCPGSEPQTNLVLIGQARFDGQRL